jgi:hypothetical protein
MADPEVLQQGTRTHTDGKGKKTAPDEPFNDGIRAAIDSKADRDNGFRPTVRRPVDDPDTTPAIGGAAGQAMTATRSITRTRRRRSTA